MRSHTAYIYFGLYGDFDPEAASARIALAPSNCAAKHSKDEVRQIPKASILDFAEVKTTEPIPDIYDLSDMVVTQLVPHREELKGIISEFGLRATLQVVLYFSVDNEVSTPIIGFSEKVIQFLSEVGALIDVDTYRS